MKLIPVFATALAFAAPAFAQQPHDSGHRDAAAPRPHHPGFTVHPGARGFVHRPLWRHPVRMARHPHLRFRFHGRTFVVLAGPIFMQPWMYYPYVSTPEYPATFYDPNDPAAGYNLYYCPSPAGYFPDVTDCPAGWWSTAPDDVPEVDPGY